ncbi:MAG: tetratricopeptide repeat protein, partial [Chitinophagaceae bacterium]|nr:tetratricopeptide repeat protein [Chitinophagaceae bacterium]
MKLHLTIIGILLSGLVYSQSYQQLLIQLKSAPQDTSTINIYKKLSNYYIITKPDSAIFYCGEGLKFASKIKSKYGEASMLTQLGVINDTHSNFNAATKYNLAALQIFIELKNELAIASLKNGLGITEGKKGNFETATKYFLEALTIFKKLNNTNGIVQSYIKLGTVNDLNGNLDKAYEYFTIANNLNKDTTNNAYFSLLNNIGIIYAKKGNMLKAIEYFEKALQSSNRPEYIDIYITNLNNCTQAYYEIGNKRKALEYHKITLAKAKEFHMPDEEARALYNFATYESHNNPALAIAYLNEALQLQQVHNGNPELTVSIYLELSKVLKETKKYEDAFVAFEKFHHLSDSFFNINKSRSLASMFADHELTEAKNQVEELELLNAKTTAERNFVIILVTAILVIAILGIRYYKKMANLNKQLTETNKVKDQLFSIIGHDLKGPVGNISQSLELIDNQEFLETEKNFLITAIKNEAQVTYETLNDLLTWGQSQLNGIRIQPIDLNVKEIVTSAISLLKKQAAIKGVNIIDFTSENEIIHADKNHIEFVFRNLISNAIKFNSFNTNVEIRSTENAGTILFSIKDHGKGIGKEQQEKFLTSKMDVNYGTNGEKGTGLGLLLTKDFIKANQGKIWIE